MRKGSKQTPESKQKISETRRAMQIKHKPETIEKISQAAKQRWAKRELIWEQD